LKLKAKSMRAIGNLAFRFWVHTFRRAFKKPRPGEELRKFLDNYSEDRLAPLSAEESAKLPEYQKCINCGACAGVCPVYSPSTAGDYRAPDSITAALTRSYPDLGEASDAVYNCTQCGACALACTRGIDIPGLVLMARRKTIEIADQAVMGLYEKALKNVADTGSVYGGNSENFEKYRKEKAEYVYFIGCTGRNAAADVTTKTLELLDWLGLDFTVIDENCCGNFHRMSGFGLADYEGAVKNIENIKTTGAGKVVTGCPHGLDIMKNCEPYKSAFTEAGIEILHETQLLAELDPEAAGSGRVAYHDPCFLGRRNGIYSEPRAIIAGTGAELVELPDHHDGSLCCGSHEGTFIIDERVSSSMAKKRMEQAAASGAGTLLTACPACLLAFRKTGVNGIELNTVAGYVAEKFKRAD